MKNKIFLYIFSLFVLTFSFTSCGEEDLVTYQEGGVLKIADAYIDILTPVVSFQAGIPDYTISMDLVNGEKKVKSIRVYSVFTDAATEGKSNEVLLATLSVPDGNKVNISKAFTYADLKNGLTVGGAALPADEKDLAVGSGWKLRFEGDSDLGPVQLNGSITIAVLSRFAGIYKVVESNYFRIGVLTAQWDGQTRFIGSVDETTFSYNDYWGNFAWGGQSFRFKIDFTSNKIEVPILVNGALFSGNRGINCETDPASFPQFDCANYNLFIPDDATGKHTIKLAYGYFTDGSGPRVFYETLEKVN